MAITALPTPPSRQDPDNFADQADALVAALVTFVTEANALQSDVNSKQSTASSAATTATTKAGEAASSRDIALAAVNYKGLWSSLSGALSIPASVFHGSSIWLLKENIASVGAEIPGVSTKWMNVTPASGLGTAAYSSATDFQPAIGALAGLLHGNGSGGISAASAAQIIAAIGSSAVANATNASSASSASSANSIVDGAVSSAAKIADGIITWVKHSAMATGKLIGRSTTGSGSPEEITIGARLTLSGGTLSADAAPVSSVNGQTGAIDFVSAAYVIGSVICGRPANNTVYTVNNTISGSSLYSTSKASGYEWTPGGGWSSLALAALVGVGSWRCISPCYADASGGFGGLWIRYA